MELIEFINAKITPKWVAEFWDLPKKIKLPPEWTEEAQSVQAKLLKALDAFINGQENEELHYFYKLMAEHTWYEPVDWTNFKKGLIEHRHPPGYLLAGESRFAILVAKSLKEDIQKLKLCDHCKKFFIGQKADIRTKYCPECSAKKPKTKEWQRDYMKNYRKDQREKTKRESREKEIERLMKVGWTREEAEDIIEADTKL